MQTTGFSQKRTTKANASMYIILDIWKFVFFNEGFICSNRNIYILELSDSHQVCFFGGIYLCVMLTVTRALTV